MLTLMILSFLASPRAALAGEDAPLRGLRCDTVKSTALFELPAFCKSAVGDEKTKVRLIDYGFQVEVLEKQCGEPEIAREIKRALNAKMLDADTTACASFARSLLESLK